MEQSRRRTVAVIALIGGAGLIATLVATGARQSPASAAPARELAYAIPGTEDRLTVEVLNGTTRVGLARLGTRMLRRQGLDVVTLGNADSVPQLTQIIVRRHGIRTAGDVLQALGVGKTRVEIDTLRRVDITVVLGTDFRPVLPLHP